MDVRSFVLDHLFMIVGIIDSYLHWQKRKQDENSDNNGEDQAGRNFR
jgi:hypothetical protein